MPSVTIERTITNRMPRGFPTGPCTRPEVAGRGGWTTTSDWAAGSAKPDVVGSSGVSLTRTTSVVGSPRTGSQCPGPRWTRPQILTGLTLWRLARNHRKRLDQAVPTGPGKAVETAARTV